MSWKKILNELSFRGSDGIPNLTNEQHLMKLYDILKEHQWPVEARVELIKNLTESEEWWTKMSPEQQADYIKKHPKSQKAQDAKEKEEKQGAQSDSSAVSMKDVNDEQKQNEAKRDKGDAGAGGAIASQGESRYCNSMNNHDDEKFKKENREAIDKKKKEIKVQAAEKEVLDALGLDYDSDEALEYLATREVFAEQELERIQKDKDSVFYKKGKKGFGGKDAPYLEWMRAAYDGTLSTRKILEEDTNLDTSKPNTTVQSTKELDDKVEADLEQKANDSNLSEEDKEYYQKELKSFKKFRKYHDTYTIGQDKNGRTHIVSISNKKGSDLKDPQNNTTPKARFEVIKDGFGEEVAETVTTSIDEGIERVSDTKQSAVRRGSKLKVSNSMVKICETKEMKSYMETLDNHGGFNKFLQSKNKDVSKLTTEEKLNLMQEYSDSLLQDGKKPAFEPFGKIFTKIGEFGRTKKFRSANSDIDFDDESVKESIQIKQDEKDAVNSAHKKVVDEIAEADKKQGFPKDGQNGPHTQAYIQTVMEAMHFDTYIDGGDGKMIIQMGIRGAKPSHIRNCLAEQSGFGTDVKTPEQREELKKYLKEKCRIDAESGAIYVQSPDGERQIAEDTWRTAGTSQKVASGFGEEMRNCVKGKVDKDRSR